MESSQKSLCLLLVVLMAFVCSSQGYQFSVGGKDGWVLNPSENYNHWAERYRFKVNDTLYFKYKKGSDSVLVVTKEEYNNCSTKNPIQSFTDGESIFKFDRSGPFYFISGNDGNCQKGQKLIIVVLAVRPKPSPPAAEPPSLAPVVPPAPAPGTPASSPAPTTGTPTPSPAPATGTPAPAPTTGTPTTSPAPSTGTPAPAPATGTPTTSPAPSTGTPAPAPATGTPTPSPGPSTGTPGPTPSTGTPGPTPSTGTPTPSPATTETPTSSPPAPPTGTPTSPPTAPPTPASGTPLSPPPGQQSDNTADAPAPSSSLSFTCSVVLGFSIGVTFFLGSFVGIHEWI